MSAKVLKAKKIELVKAKTVKTIKKKISKEKVSKQGFCVEKNSSKYNQGKFYSKKNNKEFIFRSTYELGYFHILEQDPNVMSYIVEPFEISYFFEGHKRNYWPDIMILYADGSMKIVEIKPSEHLKFRKVRAKAAAARKFVAKHFKNAEYVFVTEKDIFATEGDYHRMLRLIK